ICSQYYKYFYPAIFNNFAARMDWANEGKGNKNPFVVVNGDESLEMVTLNPRSGTEITLDASKSTDPDGDRLTYTWWVQEGVGSYTNEITINNSSTGQPTIKIPSDAGGKTFHVICEVTDDGTPNLTSYRRVIVEVMGSRYGAD
ncbi:MAG: hypothetical protein ACOC0R_06085, partial [Mariniphaga sp.]